MNEVLPEQPLTISIKGGACFETVAQEDGSILVMPKWISVKDRLPNIGDWIVSYSPIDQYRGAKIAITKYCYNKDIDQYYWNFLSSGCGCCDDDMDNVTHWMPLPEAPKEAHGS